MKYIQDISAKKVAKYIALPGIIPRIRDFFTTGFGELAYLMAMIYGSVRLLPAGHPYLLPANKGRFGMRQVIAAAGSRLVFKRENADQILIFFALLTAFVLIILQFAYIAISFVMHPAHAAPFDPAGMFNTPQPSTDVAFMLLDSVFGIPGFFGSCIDTSTQVSNGWLISNSSPCSTGTFPTPFHLGLHALFQFYSLAILLIGVLIFVYYIFIVIGETAQTGSPFGSRFDKIWAPIRLVVALGLLVPVNNGLNSAQYIVLYAARAGSGFATNAWNLYNENLDNALGVATADPNNFNSTSTTNALIAKPQAPEIYPLVEFMSLVQSCRVAYETLNQDKGATSDTSGNQYGMKIRPYLVQGQNRQLIVDALGNESVQWTDALKFYQNHDIVIRFGDDGDYSSTDSSDILTAPNKVYASEPGGVSPQCGEITIRTSDLSGAAAGGSLTGAAIAEKGYYDLILAMWIDPDMYDFGVRAACLNIKPLPKDGEPQPNANDGKCTAPTSMSTDDQINTMPTNSWKESVVSNYQSQVNMTLDQTYKSVLQNTDFSVNSEILNRGWGGAGIWYTKLAEWNGSLFDATRVVPTPSHMPQVMEQVANQKGGHDNTVTGDNQYEPYLSDGEAARLTSSDDFSIAAMLSTVDQYWKKSPTSKTELLSQGNVVVDAINMIFGTSGIFDLRNNDSIHPLAQLVALGKGIMDATMRNLLISLGFSAGSGFLGAIKWTTMAGLAGIGQQFFSLFATMGITMGFILYYILPLMPFIYFYFAVGAWVKAIFEAMVGVPLWALAHLKIEGPGLPAQSAMTGYYMILEIFLRPLLTVIGLLASIGVMSAMIRTLNSIFGLVTANVSGFDCNPCTLNLGVPGMFDVSAPRDAFDKFFFTALYTVITYLIATSCFKLIDQIPSSAMRWIGSNVPTFEDDPGNLPAERMVGYAAVGTQQLSQTIIPTMSSAAKLGGEGAGGVMQGIMSRGQQ